jgi:hypothetical protein
VVVDNRTITSVRVDLYGPYNATTTWILLKTTRADGGKRKWIQAAQVKN